MSADVAAYLPTLDDPTWVAWQADQIRRIARRHRPGTAAFRRRERQLYAALDQAFNDRLDQWHTWEWIDSVGGVVTVDRYAPPDHWYLGIVPPDRLDIEAITDAQHALLTKALTGVQSLIGNHE